MSSAADRGGEGPQRLGRRHGQDLLGRLMRKHAIRSARDDGRLLYCPLVTREMYVTGEVKALADRLFEGDPLRLAAFVGETWPEARQ